MESQRREKGHVATRWGGQALLVRTDPPFPRCIGLAAVEQTLPLSLDPPCAGRVCVCVCGWWRLDLRDLLSRTYLHSAVIQIW